MKIYRARLWFGTNPNYKHTTYVPTVVDIDEIEVISESEHYYEVKLFISERSYTIRKDEKNIFLTREDAERDILRQAKESRDFHVACVEAAQQFYDELRKKF